MEVSKRVRYVGIDMGKSSYVLRLINENGKPSGWTGSTDEKGRKELYRRLHATDKIAIEACSLAFTMNKEFKALTGTEFYILNPIKLFQIYMTDKKTDKEMHLSLQRKSETSRKKSFREFMLQQKKWRK